VVMVVVRVGEMKLGAMNVGVFLLLKEEEKQ
jgi:hypothetical protein